MRRFLILCVATASLAMVTILSRGHAWQTPAPAQRPAGRTNGIAALAVDDHTGFQQIFDGKTLAGWDGDPEFWRAENGEIVGESTAAKPLKVNTFIVWRGGSPADFELKLEYRINSTNSGVQYRSVEMPSVGKWVLKGYQADIDFDNVYTGQLYEERGRGFLAMRGQATHLGVGAKQATAVIGNGEQMKSLITPDWNQLTISARGNVLTHVLNGQLMAQTVDDDTAARSMSGLIGFQMHVGKPMKVQFRNVWLKTIQAATTGVAPKARPNRKR